MDTSEGKKEGEKRKSNARKQQPNGYDLPQKRLTVHHPRRLELLCLVDEARVLPQKARRDRLEEDVDGREGDGVAETEVREDVLVL